MPLEMRKSSNWWYGRYKVNGKVHCINLKIKVEGKRPDSISQEGDPAFERSRGRAQDRFDLMVSEIKDRRQSEDYVLKLHEIRTGRKINSIALKDLAKEWDKAPRKRKGSPSYVKQVHSIFSRFVSFVQEHYHEVESLADVTPDIAEHFIQQERSRGVGGRTCNSVLIILRSAFKALSRKANIVRNPFEGIPTQEEHTVHRKPFTEDELLYILKAAASDPFIYPVIVTGMCTAMRRGDCCTLRWSAIDLENGFITVKTSKTDETVEIPMFPLLKRLLLSLSARTGKSKAVDPEAFVFPEQAEMYLKNANGISLRVKRIINEAFYMKSEGGHRGVPEAKAKDICLAAEKYFKKLGEKPVTRRLREVLSLYIDGKNVNEIAELTGIGKGTISVHLNRIEKAIKMPVVRRRKITPASSLLQAEPIKGARRLSIRDFHSFRVTWITLALSAGVPLELVQRVTGHKTTQVVLKHYFKPGRDAFKKAIESAMPQLLVGPETAGTIDVDAVVAEPTIRYGDEKSPSEQLVEALAILKGITGKANKERVARATELIERAKDWYDGHIVRDPQVARVGL